MYSKAEKTTRTSRSYNEYLNTHCMRTDSIILIFHTWESRLQFESFSKETDLEADIVGVVITDSYMIISLNITIPYTERLKMSCCRSH
jgi:hypothetical protein